MIGPRSNNSVPRARRLKRAAIALIAFSAAWVAFMVFTSFRWFGYVGDGWLADLGDGTLYTMTWSAKPDEFTLRGWHSAPNTKPGANSTGVWTWWQWGAASDQYFGGTAGQVSYGYSIWPVGLSFAVGGACILVALRRDRVRRIRNNLCMNCGYPRLGAPAGDPCPECGHAR